MHHPVWHVSRGGWEDLFLLAFVRWGDQARTLWAFNALVDRWVWVQNQILWYHEIPSLFIITPSLTTFGLFLSFLSSVHLFFSLLLFLCCSCTDWREINKIYNAVCLRNLISSKINRWECPNVSWKFWKNNRRSNLKLTDDKFKGNFFMDENLYYKRRN